MKTFPSLVVASLCLSALVSAQSKACLAMNDASNSASRLITLKSSKGPSFWALQWTVGSTYVAQAMTISTESKFLSGFHTLEIWSHDAINKQPKARLAGGTWFMPKGSLRGWYGSNLDKVQVLSKGKTYWFVWGEPGWSGLPHQVGGKPTLPLLRKSGVQGQWAGTTGWGFKFRLFCNRQDHLNVKPFGKPCVGADRKLPTTFSNTAPRVGNAKFRIEGTGVPSAALALLILGADKKFQSIALAPAAPSCFLNTDILLMIPGKSGRGDQQSSPSVGAVHHVFFGLPIPNNSSLKGVFLGTQIAVLDAKSTKPLPMVFANGLQLTIY